MTIADQMREWLARHTNPETGRVNKDAVMQEFNEFMGPRTPPVTWVIDIDAVAHAVANKEVK